ncbi:MAG: response regulator [Chloroflexi bacterium]|nr:response regulator [Chloroflexota bacterium]
MPTSKPIEILLIEDSTTDILMTQEALHEAGLPNHLNIVEDGVKALDFLRQIGTYAQAPRPDLILLDLNLPRKNGQEVLAEIKNDPHLQQIPVVVLTTSSAEEDIMKAYALHANCYVVKPLDFISFVEVIRSIRHFWFTVVTLPSEAENG